MIEFLIVALFFFALGRYTSTNNELLTKDMDTISQTLPKPKKTPSVSTKPYRLKNPHEIKQKQAEPDYNKELVSEWQKLWRKVGK